MARAANQKLKCLYLWQFLLQNTDEEHPATIPQMIEYLARHDIPAERKSLYDDIEALRQCGLPRAAATMWPAGSSSCRN